MVEHPTRLDGDSKTMMRFIVLVCLLVLLPVPSEAAPVKGIGLCRQHPTDPRCVVPTPTPTATSTPTPTPTSTPSPTPTPTPTPTPVGSPPLPSGWTLAFEDNFDGSAGTAPDSTKWNLYNSPGHAGNGLRRPSQCKQDGNGLLVLTAEAKTDPADGVLKTWSCGMSAKPPGHTIYGRFESRVRTEVDLSGTMSGLTLTWPDSGDSHLDGELDWYETGHGTSRNPFYSYLHSENCPSGTTCQTQIVHNADATQWHTMTMDWTASAIKIYRDGVLIGTLTDAAKIPDVYHHAVTQLDAFNTRPIPSVVHEYVDYLRVYNATVARTVFGSQVWP